MSKPFPCQTTMEWTGKPDNGFPSDVACHRDFLAGAGGKPDPAGAPHSACGKGQALELRRPCDCLSFRPVAHAGVCAYTTSGIRFDRAKAAIDEGDAHMFGDFTSAILRSLAVASDKTNDADIAQAQAQSGQARRHAGFIANSRLSRRPQSAHRAPADAHAVCHARLQAIFTKTLEGQNQRSGVDAACPNRRQCGG